MYEVVIAARTPHQATPPTLTEIGPIPDARGLKWVSQLNGVGSAQLTTSPGTLSDDILTRLRNLRANPCELWVNRNGTRVFAGPIISPGVGEDGDVQLTAPGLLYYCRYMEITSDLTFSGIDQWLIARTLIDQWQSQDWGDYGIDVSAVTTSGVTRDRTYLGASEEHPVMTRLEQLAAVIDGFDFWTDPTTRELLLADARGSDLSATVILDSRGIISPGSFTSVAAGDIASEAFGRSYDPDTDTLLTSVQANTTVRESFGRCAISDTFDGVVIQGTLDGHTQELLVPRAEPLFVAQPNLIPAHGAGVEDFDAGDIVTWDFDDGLGRRTEARRVSTRSVTVGDDGAEQIDVGFI